MITEKSMAFGLALCCYMKKVYLICFTTTVATQFLENCRNMSDIETGINDMVWDDNKVRTHMM